jgi:hypothetical protein
MSTDAEDQMTQIGAEAAKRFAVFDAERKRLLAQYEKAQSPRARLRIIAQALRHHHSYMANTLIGGWYLDSLLTFANAIDLNVEEL